MTPGAFVEIETIRGPVRVVDAHSPLSMLLSRPAVTVPPSCTLDDAVAAMRKASVSALLVGSTGSTGGRDGIVTERDLARALGAGCTPDDPVELIMTRHPVAVSAHQSVTAAAAMMLNEQVRHLVVELDGGAVAVVSISDGLAVLLQAVEPKLWLTSLRVAIESPTEVWLG